MRRCCVNLLISDTHSRKHGGPARRLEKKGSVLQNLLRVNGNARAFIGSGIVTSLALDVKEISNYGADNLAKTSTYLIEVIKDAKERNRKIVCFVTGVPGAGKTLVGLDVVHEKEAFGGTDTNTAYFSGNVPLVNVLREALARDDYNRQQQLHKKGELSKKPVKEDSKRKVKSKIQKPAPIYKR